MATRMKQIIKRTLILSAVFIVFAAGIFLTARHGWRLLGFAACDGAVIERISVTEECVEIEGRCPGLFPDSFVGYRTEMENGTLYVGVKHNAFLGVLPQDSGIFRLRISVKEPVRTVYLKTKRNEFLLWDNENGPTAPQEDSLEDESYEIP